MSSALAHNQTEQRTRDRINLRNEVEHVLTLSRYLIRPEYRRAMVLRHREGWKTADIAKDLGLSYDQTDKLLRRLARLTASREFILISLCLEKVPLRLHLVGECLYLNAMTLDETAEATNQTKHQVRAAKREIEGIALGALGSNVPSYRGHRNTPSNTEQGAEAQ